MIDPERPPNHKRWVHVYEQTAAHQYSLCTFVGSSGASGAHPSA